MKMKVIGMKDVDFTTKDNQKISGCKLFCTLEDKTVTGVACESIFLSTQKLKDLGYAPTVGDELYVSYNKYGKIDNVNVA